MQSHHRIAGTGWLALDIHAKLSERAHSAYRLVVSVALLEPSVAAEIDAAYVSPIR